MKISPFSKNERDEIKTLFVHIDRANSLLSHHINKPEISFFDIPCTNDYKEIMRRIGNDYRKKLAKSILKEIMRREAWVTNHLVTLYELGWGDGNSLKSLVKFNEGSKTQLSDDEFLPIKHHINNELLPDCKRILEVHIKENLS